MKELFGSPVIVTVPAQPDLMHVIRSVVAGVAVRLDFSFDQIDDLRIAVDEACAPLFPFAASDGDLQVRITPTSQGLELVAGVTGRPEAAAAWPPPVMEGSLAWQVLSALVDEVSFGTEGDRLTVRLLKVLPEDPS